MGHHTRSESLVVTSHPSRSERDAVSDAADLASPFGKLDGVDHDDLRETAYEIFFTACRSSPGFGGRNALTYCPSDGSGEGGGSGPGSPVKANGVGMALTSRIKRALGLKMLKRSQSRRTSSCGSNPSSPNAHNSNPGSSPGMAFTVPQVRSRRPMTSAEIMRQQMKVTEQSDNRLRKTLMRTLMGRRAETIILPLELLRHLKPSEFNSSHEYHLWQKRLLKILETGLILHPSIPLDKSNTFAMRLREFIRACETKPIDTGKNSESMRTLCNCVVSLSWRSPDGSPTDVCHWADGFPLNVHIYNVLLHSIFDLKDETLVLDEIDELIELMKKTWSTLGINRSMHNLCFTWVLFEQYVSTGQVEVDLLCATLAMMAEVANDAKRADREPIYVKMLASVLTSIKRWIEKRLLDYHGSFNKVTVGLMENLLPLVFSATKILEEDVTGISAAGVERGEERADSTGNRVDHYIRSSLRNAFAKTLENGQVNGMIVEVKEVSEALLKLADETEELAMKEKEIFSPMLKKWHPISAGAAAVTLHTCYGTLLKQYLAGSSSLSNETISILQRAGKLEKVLVQMVVEDSVECEDGGKTIVREMVPYEVDSIILNLLKQWIQQMLKKGRECLQRAKETETWNPKSKTEPYAQSAVELMKYAKDAVEDFFEIQTGISEDLVQDLADGLEHLIRDYTTFVASCGSKQSYIPTLPPLTRCSRDSKFIMLWKKATPCSVGVDGSHQTGSNEGHHPRPSTSRGTQRVYIRLNTLHYLLSQLHSDNARVRPALRILKQNLTLLGAIVTDRAQPLAIKEVMKASFEAYLMVLLAGGSSRIFSRSDHEMIEDDFDSLKRVFCTCGEGLIAEDCRGARGRDGGRSGGFDGSVY
ncbi:hypothetical protein F0562_035333 [Nyssa sinensis]|uniref:MHD1 domain-containing protein n=1 Tax=Nyssa sinensis TaxID=561372 RepID=A0A5J5ACH1_9ASTE|nr:hypothetical protein F0562_035333 [Nyssa sinensis]